MHGKGKLEKKGKVLFEGEFDRGMKSGYAVFTTDEGAYLGNFRNDYLEGEGTFVWNDGKIYKGNFKKTKFDGNGVIYYPSGQVAEGRWEENHNKSLSKLNYEPSIVRKETDEIKEAYK